MSQRKPAGRLSLQDPTNPFCYVDYCARAKSRHFGLFCVGHWNMIPAHLREAIIAGNAPEQIAALNKAMGGIHEATARAYPDDPPELKPAGKPLDPSDPPPTKPPTK